MSRAHRSFCAPVGALVAALAASLVCGAAQAAVPDPGGAILDQARVRAAAGDLAPLRDYVSAHPEDRDAMRLLGDDQFAAGRVADAEATYRALLHSAPGDKATHDRLGRLYAAGDRIDEAIAEFEASLPDVAAYEDLVRLHERRGDLDAFVVSFRDKANASPFDPAAQFGYGVVLRRIHRPTEALERLQAAERLAPRTCAVLDEIGNALLDLDRTSEAVASFETCLAIDRSDYAAHVDEAVARLDDPSGDARSLLERAIAIRPNRPEAYVDLGYLEDAAQRPDVAAADYDRALSLDPFFRDAYVNLGYSYLSNGRLRLAEETFLRGLGVSHEDGRIEYLLGETLAKQGKSGLADRAYRIATTSDEPEVAAAAKDVLRKL